MRFSFPMPFAPPPAFVAPAAPIPFTALPLKPPITLGAKPNPLWKSVAGSMRNARFPPTRISSALLSVVPKKSVHGDVVQPVPALPDNAQARDPTDRFCQAAPPLPFAVSTWPFVAAPEPICAVVTPPLAMEIVPLVLIGPPVNPAPVAIFVTVPPAPPAPKLWPQHSVIAPVGAIANPPMWMPALSSETRELVEVKLPSILGTKPGLALERNSL